MRRTGLAAAASAILLLLLVGGPAFAASYSRVATLDLPGGQKIQRFDISWFDRASHTYILADRTNAQLDTYDTATGTWRIIGHGDFVGFTGSNDHSGPDGVLVIRDQHQIWAGDGNSSVKVLDSGSGALLDTIATGGTARADEMAYDQKDHLLVVANDADTPPYLTFIGTRSRTILGKLQFPGASGLEQTLWDPQTHLIYASVPMSGPDDEVAVIDPTTRQFVAHFPVAGCGPTGLALDPIQHLLVGCDNAPTRVLDARSGAVLASYPQIGGEDEVWYNPGDHHFYLAAGSATPHVLGVIDAPTLAFLGTAPTFAGAHSVAADPNTDRIYVPLPAGAPGCPNGCIGVYAGS